ncbi:MAG: AMP-binding protein [Alphaproteobacteria bacterium]|nr:AMP-binding protein [Alphaproteobacteria bacterium]
MIPATASRVAYDPDAARRSLFEALVAARRQYGGSKPVLIDADERILNYDTLVKGALALGHALKRDTSAGERVGIMLPTGAAATVTVFAVSAFGRVPTMINFTGGAANILSALKTAQVSRIVTAHRFIKLAKLEELAATISERVALVYLEEVRKNLTLLDKAAAAAGSLLPSLLAARPDSDSCAVILFTSGTEGAPKGVALSHANLLSNVAQVRAHIELSAQEDVLFNPLPVFHCFGLAVGTLMPLIAGVKVVSHPTPLQPKEIVKRIKTHSISILITTDTFIGQYARAGEEGDLDSVRLAVCGAERVRDETRAFVRQKYGIQILEGYGVTEASPVVAANQVEANHPGTVGRLMAAMEARLEPVEGIPDGGRLKIKGPNVMLGYMLPEAPGVIVPLPDGWHDTGDVASVDEGGFITIRGRLKRFAKIGGETVSLAVVENVAAALWPGRAHAAVSLPDPRKGEQIVLVTDAAEATRPSLLAWAQHHGVSELAVPRRVLIVHAIPVLGTGKTDYVAVQKLATADCEPNPDAYQ